MSQMFPPDMAAALGAGGGAPAGGGGLPPDLAALLGGGGGGAPAPSGNTVSQGGSPGGGSDLVGQAIDILVQAAQEEADDQDKQTILTCITNLQGVLANNQKDADAMMGGKASPRAMRKAAGAQGYGG